MQETQERNYWMVRAGRDSVLFDKFKSGNIVAINFPDVGDLTGKSDEEIRAAVEQKLPNPDYNAQQRGGIIGAHRTICLRMSRGDGVVTRVAGLREYLLGEVTDDECQYQTKEEGYRHYRAVKWHEKTVSRDSLSPDAKYSLGGLSTIFQIQNEYWEEMYSQLSPDSQEKELQKDANEARTSETDALRGDINKRVEDKIAKLHWKQMEYLVAALLRAMGYKTLMTPPGGDGGTDIYASPDGLMIGEPRIRAEVKHRKGSSMNVGDIRRFDSAKGAARGIFVSTGGYTKEAITEARGKDITVLNLEQLAELVVQHYDKFDAEGRDLLPMQKLYLPVGD